jgi:hypothetical protein
MPDIKLLIVTIAKCVPIIFRQNIKQHQSVRLFAMEECYFIYATISFLKFIFACKQMTSFTVNTQSVLPDVIHLTCVYDNQSLSIQNYMHIMPTMPTMPFENGTTAIPSITETMKQTRRLLSGGAEIFLIRRVRAPDTAKATCYGIGFPINIILLTALQTLHHGSL